MKKERFIPQQATYTAKEAAAYLKVSERQIRNFITRKLLRKSKAQIGAAQLDFRNAATQKNRLQPAFDCLNFWQFRHG